MYTNLGPNLEWVAPLVWVTSYIMVLQMCLLFQLSNIFCSWNCLCQLGNMTTSWMLTCFKKYRTTWTTFMTAYGFWLPLWYLQTLLSNFVCRSALNLITFLKDPRENNSGMVCLVIWNAFVLKKKSIISQPIRGQGKHLEFQIILMTT